VHELKESDSFKPEQYRRRFRDFLPVQGEYILDIALLSDEGRFQTTALGRLLFLMRLYRYQCMIKKLVYGARYQEIGVTGPIFFEDTINSDRYCQLILYPFFGHLNEDDNARRYLQQDGATALTAYYVSTALLRDIFCEQFESLISSDIWPPRSLVLNPSEFYLWGAMEASHTQKQSPQSPSSEGSHHSFY
jgi:hypothetical protein